MKFHNHKTYYDHIKASPVARQFMGGDTLKSPDTYYGDTLRTLAADALQKGHIKGDEAVIGIQATSEYSWVMQGRPYFRVYPSMIPVFSKCPIDIPIGLMKFPHDLDAFSVELPTREDGNPLIVDDEHYVKSMLVYRSNNESFARICKEFSLPTEFYRDSNQNRMVVWLDIGEKEGSTHHPLGSSRNSTLPDMAVYTYKQLAWESNEETIDQAMRKLPNGPDFDDGVVVSEKTVDQCIRLIVSICFLAESDDPLIVHDVMPDEAASSRFARHDRILQMQERAKKKGRVGWLVGGDLGTMTVSDRPLNETDSDEAHQLSYSHIRRGHWHTTRYGPSRTLKKVIWYRQTRVRPDLPLPPS